MIQGLPETVPIENTEFVRDMRSKAVVSTDVNGLQRYRAARVRSIAQRNESVETKKRLASLERDIEHLKSLVASIKGSKTA